MEAIRDPMNQFGLEVTAFCAQQGMTKKQLAALAGIPYDTLLQTGKGRCAGHTARKAIKEVMNEYAERAGKQEDRTAI